MIVWKSAVFVHTWIRTQPWHGDANREGVGEKAIRAWKRFICLEIKIVAYRKLRVCIINMRKKNSNESLIFITHIFGAWIQSQQIFFPTHSLTLSLASFDYFTWAFVCNCVCISAVIPSIRCDYFTVVLYLVCSWAQNERQKWYPKDLLLFDTRIHTHTHKHIRMHTLHISTHKKRQINK